MERLIHKINIGGNRIWKSYPWEADRLKNPLKKGISTWHEGWKENREGTITGEGVACSSDVVFLEGPAGYCHLKQNDKIKQNDQIYSM